MNLGIGLGLTNYLRVPTVALDPDAAISDLFRTGTPGVYYEGAWYDPSDSTTVFQDAAGTTPAGVGDPVGLILDKSKGLTPGSELVTNGTFDADTDWTKGTGWSIASGFATKSPGTGSNLEQVYSFVVGQWYRLTFDVVRRTNGAMQIQIGGGTALSVTGFVFWTVGTHSVYFTPNTGNSILRFVAGSTFDADIDNVSLVTLSGNHATQTTSAARPVLQSSGGLYYLDFDGVDDNLSTASIDFTASDQMTTAAAVERQNATAGIIAELSSNWNVNTGTFLFWTGTNTSGVGNGFGAASRGTAGASGTQFAYTTAIYTPPAKAVLVGLHDISDDYTKIRFDGTDSFVATGDKGLGNFSNNPIYFGSRGGTTTFPFEGLFFGVVIVNRSLTAGEISNLESYLATKSGFTAPVITGVPTITVS